MESEEGVKLFPDLAPAYAALQAAVLLSKEKISRPVDQDGFVSRVREQITRRIEAGQHIADARPNKDHDREL